MQKKIQLFRAGYACLTPIVTLSLACCGLLLPTHAISAEQPFVAGLTPYQRPAGFPVLTTPPAFLVRSAQATHGISAPVPESISNFLKYQGAWYTPFSRPGAKQPYDIRSWYAQDKSVSR